MFAAQLEAVIAGDAPVDSCVRSQLDFWVYQQAVKVLDALRCHRIQMMDEHPEEVGNLIRAEVLRIHGLRRRTPRPPPKVQQEPAVHRPEWMDWT